MIRFYTNDIEERCGGESSKTFEIRIPMMRLDASIHSPRSPNNLTLALILFRLRILTVSVFYIDQVV